MSQEAPRAEMAESELLGSVILDPYVIQEHRLDEVPPEAFYSESLRHWWKAVLKLHWDGNPIDMATVVEEVRSQGTLEKAGGVATLMGAMDTVGVAHHAPQYARSIMEAYEKRRALEVLGQGMSYCYNGKTFNEIQATVEHGLQRIRKGDSGGLNRAIEAAKAYLENETRVPTGWQAVDELTGGLPMGDLTVLAGRTSMGKSAFCHAIAFHVGSTHVLTPDQPLPEIIVNETCRRTRIPFAAIKRNELGDDDKKRWLAELQNVQQILEQHVTFDDRSLTLDRMAMEVKRAARTGKKLVIVDHIQRIHGDRRQSRREVMVEITSTLKDLARDNDISVLALSQLSRSIDERESRVPNLTDLSESKSIEEDANMVLFLYRDKYYNPNSTRGDVTDVILAKDKTGPRMATAQLVFDSRFVTFKQPGFA